MAGAGAYERGVNLVVDANQPILIGGLAQEFRFGIPVFEGVEIVGHVVRRSEVCGGGHGVAGEKRGAFSSTDEDGLMSAGMSGRGQEPDSRQAFGVSLVQAPGVGLVERGDIFRAVRGFHGAEAGFGVFILAALDVHARIGESRKQSATRLPGQTAGVIEVQVRDNDVGD